MSQFPLVTDRIIRMSHCQHLLHRLSIVSAPSSRCTVTSRLPASSRNALRSNSTKSCPAKRARRVPIGFAEPAPAPWVGSRTPRDHSEARTRRVLTHRYGAIVNGHPRFVESTLPRGPCYPRNRLFFVRVIQRTNRFRGWHPISAAEDV